MSTDRAKVRTPKHPAKPIEAPAPACARCLKLALDSRIDMETVQPLPPGAEAPLARDGSGKCCHDCAAAETLLQLTPAVPGFTAARIAVGNDRREQYRLPGVPLGLVQAGIVRPSKRGDFEKHMAWLDSHQWFGQQYEGEDGEPR